MQNSPSDREIFYAQGSTYWVIYQNPNGKIKEIERSLILDEILSEKVQACYNPCQTHGDVLATPYRCPTDSGKGIHDHYLERTTTRKVISYKPVLY